MKPIEHQRRIRAHFDTLRETGRVPISVYAAVLARNVLWPLAFALAYFFVAYGVRQSYPVIGSIMMAVLIVPFVLWVFGFGLMGIFWFASTLFADGNGHLRSLKELPPSLEQPIRDTIDEFARVHFNAEVHKIRVILDMNAAMFIHPRFLFGKRRTLLMGLPFFFLMGRNHLRSIVGHEMAHARHKSPARWLSLMHMAVLPIWGIAFVARWIMSEDSTLFHALQLHEELVADREAAKVTSPRDIASTLVLMQLAIEYQATERKGISASDPKRFYDVDALDQMGRDFREKLNDAEWVISVLRNIEELETDEGFTHPSLRMRVSFLGLGSSPEEMARLVSNDRFSSYSTFFEQTDRRLRNDWIELSKSVARDALEQTGYIEKGAPAEALETNILLELFDDYASEPDPADLFDFARYHQLRAFSQCSNDREAMEEISRVQQEYSNNKQLTYARWDATMRLGGKDFQQISRDLLADSYIPYKAIGYGFLTEQLLREEKADELEKLEKEFKKTIEKELGKWERAHQDYSQAKVQEGRLLPCERRELLDVLWTKRDVKTAWFLEVHRDSDWPIEHVLLVRGYRSKLVMERQNVKQAVPEKCHRLNAYRFLDVVVQYHGFGLVKKARNLGIEPIYDRAAYGRSLKLEKASSR